MGDDTTETTEAPKKKGFFRRLFKWAVIAGAVAGAIAFFKRRRGQDLDDAEWQELPPPAGG